MQEILSLSLFRSEHSSSISAVLHTIQLFLVSITVTVCYDSYIIYDVMEDYKTKQSCLKYQNSLILRTFLGFIIF